MSGQLPDVQAAVDAVTADLASRLGVLPAQVTVSRADVRVTLRVGERVWHYLVRADGIARRLDSAEPDGGQYMAPPPRMDL